jgi:hypothetical protein
MMDLDREMRCRDCGRRLFSSRAPELVEHAMPCPECDGVLELVPPSHSPVEFEQRATRRWQPESARRFRLATGKPERRAEAP